MYRTRVYLALTGLLLLLFSSCSANPEQIEDTVNTVEDSSRGTENTSQPAAQDRPTETVADMTDNHETKKESVTETTVSEIGTHETIAADSTVPETSISEDVVPVSMEVKISTGHYIGDCLTAADFTVKVNMSDGSVLDNPNGWAAAPLELSAAENQVTVTYESVSSVITVNAAQRELTGSAAGSSQVTAGQPSNLSINGIDVCRTAMQYIGIPYVYGGESLTDGVDCSGYTYAIYKMYGISLPRTAAEQAKVGVEVAFEDALPGDLVVTVYEPGGKYTGHAGIYVGNGMMLSSEPGYGVDYGSADGYMIRRFYNNTASAGDNVLTTEWLEAGNTYIVDGLLIDGVPYIYAYLLLGEIVTVDIRDSNLQNGVYTCTPDSERATVPKQYIDAAKQRLTNVNYMHMEYRNGEQLYWLSDGTEFIWLDVQEGRITQEQLEQGYSSYRYEKFW